MTTARINMTQETKIKCTKFTSTKNKYVRFHWHSIVGANCENSIPICFDTTAKIQELCQYHLNDEPQK